MARATRKQKDDWIIAIPSYKRPETLRDKTLTVLKYYGIPASKIHVFVATKEQADLYRDTLVEEAMVNSSLVSSVWAQSEIL